MLAEVFDTADPLHMIINLEAARTLMSYDHWATQIVFQAAQKLRQIEYYGRGKVRPGNIHGNLTHIVVVHHYWLSRWKRQDPFLRPENIQSREDLQRFWNEIREQTAVYLKNLNCSDQVNQVFYEPDHHGTSFSHSWSESVLQVVLHSTTLRGQIVLHLRRLQKDPGPLDFISYSRSLNT